MFYDTVSFSVPSLECALGAVGPGQIVLGTDYPHVIGDPGAALSTVRALGLREPEAAGILGGTAARLFPRLMRASYSNLCLDIRDLENSFRS